MVRVSFGSDENVLELQCEDCTLKNTDSLHSKRAGVYDMWGKKKGSTLFPLPAIKLFRLNGPPPFTLVLLLFVPYTSFS